MFWQQSEQKNTYKKRAKSVKIKYITRARAFKVDLPLLHSPSSKHDENEKEKNRKFFFISFFLQRFLFSYSRGCIFFFFYLFLL
jgi:hypothetical protein